MSDNKAELKQSYWNQTWLMITLMALSALAAVAGLYQLYVLGDKREHVMLSLIGSGLACVHHLTLWTLTLVQGEESDKGINKFLQNGGKMEGDKFQPGWLSWVTIIVSGVVVAISAYSLYMSLVHPKKRSGESKSRSRSRRSSSSKRK